MKADSGKECLWSLPGQNLLKFFATLTVWYCQKSFSPHLIKFFYISAGAAAAQAPSPIFCWMPLPLPHFRFRDAPSWFQATILFLFSFYRFICCCKQCRHTLPFSYRMAKYRHDEKNDGGKLLGNGQRHQSYATISKTETWPHNQCFQYGR